MAGKRKRGSYKKSYPKKKKMRALSNLLKGKAIRFGGWSKTRGAKPELKYKDSGGNQKVGNDANTPIFALLNGIAQNATVTGRVGNKVALKSIMLRLWAKASAIPLQLRVMIVMDQQANKATPNAGSNLLNIQTIVTDSAVAGVDLTQNLTNLDYRDRFRIIMDKQFKLDIGAIDTSDIPYGESKAMHKFIKLPNVECTYSDAGGAIGNINTNALYLAVWANVAGANGADVNWMSRIRFVDY